MCLCGKTQPPRRKSRKPSYSAIADGEFVYVVYEKGEAKAYNRWGRVYTADELIALRQFKSIGRGIHSLKLTSELYASEENHALSLPEYKKAVTRAPEKVKLGVFGLKEINGVPVANDWLWQMDELQLYFAELENIQVLPFRAVKDYADLKAFWDSWVAGFRFEGVVTRGSAGLFKIKPEVTIDALIVGVKKTKSFQNGRVASLRLALMEPNGDLVNIGDAGLPDVEAGQKLYAMLDYLKVAEDRDIVYVKPILIVEIRFYDVYKGQRPAWRWNNSKYVSLPEKTFYSMKSPVVLRFREDKTFCVSDLRIEQIPEVQIVEVPARASGSFSVASIFRGL